MERAVAGAWVRALLVTVCSGLLAAAAHLAGGGQIRSPLLLLPLLGAVPPLQRALRREAGAPLLLGAVGGLQLGGHLLLRAAAQPVLGTSPHTHTAGTAMPGAAVPGMDMPGTAMPGMDMGGTGGHSPAMLAAHLLAAVVVVVGLRVAERSWCGAVRLARAARQRLSPVAAARAAVALLGALRPPAGPAAPVVPERTLAPPRAVHLRSTLRRRGPPARLA